MSIGIQVHMRINIAKSNSTNNVTTMILTIDYTTACLPRKQLL